MFRNGTVVSPDARREFLEEWEREQVTDGGDELQVTQPYPGLRSFRKDENTRFFGRDAQVSELRNIMTSRNVVFVLGGSGSGKSSLVKAGLIPTLQTNPIPERPGVWYSVEFRPGEAPSERFAHAIVDDVIGPAVDMLFNTDDGSTHGKDRADRIQTALRSLLALTDDCFVSNDVLRNACLRAICANILDEKGHVDLTNISWLADFIDGFDRTLSRGASAAPANVMVVLDQFEELFEDKISDTERSKIIELIKYIFERPRGSLYLAVTMRSEELHRCSEHIGLANVVNKTFYLVDLIDGDNLTAAIRSPAQIVLKSWGLPHREPFSPDALRALEATYSGDSLVPLSADKLPLIQHLLPLAWDRAVSRWSAADDGQALRVEINDLRALPGWGDTEHGTLRSVLSRRADQVFAEAVKTAAPSAERRSRLAPDADDLHNLLKVAFVLLTKEDNRGNPKRAFVSINDIVHASGLIQSSRNPRSSAWVSMIEQTLHKFESAGLITKTLDGEVEKYTVLHEAFIRGWKKYVEWVADNKAAKKALVSARKLISSESTSVPATLWSWLLASREQTASVLINERDARILNDNIYSDQPLFSKQWAEGVLKSTSSLD